MVMTTETKMDLQMVSVSIDDSAKLGERDYRGSYLVWEDLTVVLPTSGDNGALGRLLSGISGFAEPGRIMAIMGPSGSGKSTLLDSLAGRLSASVIMSTGKVIINGKKRSLDCRDIAYVTQEDVFLGTLTVRETITYAAHLRIPTKMTKDDLNEVVEKAIIEMGLQDCADNKIGNWHYRGTSTGERRRLSICLEILTHPHVLFLDEPTSGLDSASSFFVIRALRSVAHGGKIVICSIHQPSSDVFNLFDDLFLLSGGEAVYFGEAKMAVKFFADAGFPCPIRRNPSDHFLRCITSDFDRVTAALLRTEKSRGSQSSSDPLMNFTTAEIKATLVEEYKSSAYSINMKTRIQEIALLTGGHIAESKKENHVSWWKQLCTLTRRSFLNMFRDLGYYWLRMVFYILVSLTVGQLYLHIGQTNWAIIARGKCDAFIYGFMICLSVGGLPFFIEELKVYNREKFSTYHRESAFVLSNFLSSFPFIVFTSLSSGTIIYYMVHFHPGLSRYTYFCINLFCCISIVETCMMVVALLVPNLLMGIGTGTALIVLMMLASEISRSLPDLPKFFWRYPMSYISFASWAIQGQFKNDMVGLEFDPLVYGDTKLKGEDILLTTYGIELNYSKWWDLTALIVLLLTYKILLFLVLKYKKRASSFLQRLYAHRTIQHLARRPLLKRDEYISSKRLPLSAQEGARSPIA